MWSGAKAHQRRLIRDLVLQITQTHEVPPGKPVDDQFLALRIISPASNAAAELILNKTSGSCGGRPDEVAGYNHAWSAASMGLQSIALSSRRRNSLPGVEGIKLSNSPR